MSQLTISEVASQVGLRPSAIRYYEQIGILLPAERASGQRRYDTTVLYRLALIQRARQLGFTLDEIKELFFGFSNTTPISKRWHKLAQRKLNELAVLMEQMKTMQVLLYRIQDKCCCSAIDQCGKGIFLSGCSDGKAKQRAKGSKLQGFKVKSTAEGGYATQSRAK